MATSNALDIAYHLVKKYADEGKPLTNIKLQKLLYFAWILHYNNTGERLFDNKFYAWKFGPVVEDVYYMYRTYAAMPIYRPLGKTEPQINKELKSLIDLVFKEYSNKTLTEIIKLAHDECGSWNSVYKDGIMDIEIPFDRIIKYDCPRFKLE
ncbi:MAG: DUF4065 domain-containing protein [Candidatus Methanomethylophilaceae archaeon]|nr:DUF4065 domain-containing protein [Candidatus Methanomethylophilaceae archaeon]